MRKKFNLTPAQLDSIKEITSIGMSHAMTSLSKMINRPVMLVIPKVELTNFGSMNSFPSADKKELFVGVYSRILGKITGQLLILFEKKRAFTLIDILMNRNHGTTKVFSEIEQSCIMEIGSILTAGCLNALAEFLKMTLIPSIPHFVFDYGENISRNILQELSSDYTFVINSEFKTKEDEINGKFLLFPDEDSLTTIWETFKIK